MSQIKNVSFNDLITTHEYEQVNISSPSEVFIQPGTIPPPPSSIVPTIQLTSLTPLPPPPSSNDLNEIMKTLKRPTQQHIVDFKERYEQAVKIDQEKLNQTIEN